MWLRVIVKKIAGMNIYLGKLLTLEAYVVNLIVSESSAG